MRIVAALLALSLAGSGCTWPGAIRPTTAQQVQLALDLSTCTAADVLPGVGETITALAGDGSALAKVLAGVIGGGGALGRAYGCYTRAMAAVRTQAEPPPQGEAAQAAKPEREIIEARAKACSVGGRCPRPEFAAAYALQQLLVAGVVTLPASSPGRVIPLGPSPTGEGSP